QEAGAGAWLSEHGVECEDGRILIRRFIRSSGKSGAWIGSAPVARQDLAEFSSFLVDIHGQHEHQLLMKIAEHRKFLDARAGITADVAAFTALYMELVGTRRRLEQLSVSAAERERKAEMLRFAAEEIRGAALKPGEDERLEAEEARLASFERLYAGIEAVRSTLDGGDSAVLPQLKKLRRESQGAAAVDKSLAPLDARLESSFYELSDIAEEFNSYAQKLVYDPAHLTEVQERLSLIYNLKKKYASSQSAPLQEVFDYLAEAERQLEQLDAGGQNRTDLEAAAADLERRVYSSARALSERRRAVGGRLSQEVEELLSVLGMKGARFAVSVQEKPGSSVEQKCGPYGMDNVEFLISSNTGSPLLPLAKIASGGELSRVMLAIKTIFAQSDPVQTLVFDEIDTGIGGEVAVAVGSHLKALAASRQIFCITHLASIAVYADNQIKIEKGVAGGRTASTVHPVAGEERVAEIARMLSGDADSMQSLEHARAMLQKFSGGF
ncbi:MAG: DNA repair protein RecN, partial [Treponemataceae bacterium]|nr:DNA repair protein RecN [Treponemataceae bacterium]